MRSACENSGRGGETALSRTEKHQISPATGCRYPHQTARRLFPGCVCETQNGCICCLLGLPARLAKKSAQEGAWRLHGALCDFGKTSDRAGPSRKADQITTGTLHSVPTTYATFISSTRRDFAGDDKFKAIPGDIAASPFKLSGEKGSRWNRLSITLRGRKFTQV